MERGVLHLLHLHPLLQNNISRHRRSPETLAEEDRHHRSVADGSERHGEKQSRSRGLFSAIVGEAGGLNPHLNHEGNVDRG